MLFIIFFTSVSSGEFPGGVQKQNARKHIDKNERITNVLFMSIIKSCLTDYFQDSNIKPKNSFTTFEPIKNLK